MCCIPNGEEVRAATHYHTLDWQTLIRKICYIIIVHGIINLTVVTAWSNYIHAFLTVM